MPARVQRWCYFCRVDCCISAELHALGLETLFEFGAEAVFSVYPALPMQSAATAESDGLRAWLFLLQSMAGRLVVIIIIRQVCVPSPGCEIQHFPVSQSYEWNISLSPKGSADHHPRYTATDPTSAGLSLNQPLTTDT